MNKVFVWARIFSTTYGFQELGCKNLRGSKYIFSFKNSLKTGKEHECLLLFCSSPEERTWVWDYEGQPFHYDLDEPVRLRVESEIWFDITPERESSLKSDDKEPKKDAKVPYTIIVRVCYRMNHGWIQYFNNTNATFSVGLYGWSLLGMYILVGGKGRNWWRTDEWCRSNGRIRKSSYHVGVYLSFQHETKQMEGTLDCLLELLHSI